MIRALTGALVAAAAHAVAADPALRFEYQPAEAVVRDNGTPGPQVKMNWGYHRLGIEYAGDMDAAAPRSIEYSSMAGIGVVADHGFRGVSAGGEWYFWCGIADSARRDACCSTASSRIRRKRCA